MKYKYRLDGLDCGNCAAKIQSHFEKNDEFSNVNLSFATKTLTFNSDKKIDMDIYIKNSIDKIEDGITPVNLLYETKETNNKEKNKNFTTLRLVISVTSLVTAIVFKYLNLFSNNNLLIAGLCTVAVLFAGINILISGVKSVFRLRLDETTLMTIAVIAAFFLGEYIEAGLVTVLFFIGSILENKAVASSRKQIENLANIRPDTGTLIINGIEKEVPAESITVNQTILVKPHERIPLDGIITKGSGYIDTSAITGESIPIKGNINTEVMSGMMNGESVLEIKVTKPFTESTATRILNLVEEASAQKSNREKIITRFASVYTPIMLLLSVLIATIPPLLNLGSFNLWLYRALVCLVAACPCSIVISVPLAYYSGIGAISKVGVLIKGGKYVEALAKADSFVFDKTGTITTGKLNVTNITSYSTYNEKEVLNLAAACEEYSSHPIATSIKIAADKDNLPELKNISEVPGFGIKGIYKGKEISCTNIKALNNEQLDIAFQKNNDDSVFIILDKTLIGSIAVTDTVRKEAKGVISKLKQLGAKSLVMLTGDNKNTAKKVADSVGMTNYYAELLPEDKVTKMQDQINTYGTGCFIGDGINDAPVLAASDCGIAMGLGSEAAIEAADAVLTSGDLKRLPDAVKLARKVVSTVKVNIGFSLAVKFIVITLATLGIAPMWLAVLSDTGVSLLCVFNTIRLLKVKKPAKIANIK